MVTLRYFDILKELISNGIGVNDITDSMYGNKMTPLHFAAQFGRKDIVEYLLSFGANPDVQNQFRWKPLDLAVSQKKYRYNSTVITMHHAV